MDAKILAGSATLLALATAIILSNNPSTSEYKSVYEISQAEEIYYAKTGHYFQVLPGSISPEYQKGKPETELGKNLPPEYRVDIYETSDGQEGYSITLLGSTTKATWGYGPKAKDYTVYVPASTELATTTP